MTNTQELLEAADDIRRALLSNDVGTLTRLVSKDYCGFDPTGGKQDRVMMLQAYGPSGVRLHTYEISEVATRIFGEVGLIMGVGTLSGTYGEHRFAHNLRFLDVYVHDGSTWLLSVSQVTELKALE